MNDKCKCKNPNKYIEIKGIGLRCARCLKWIVKFRQGFHKQTQIKKSDKIYNRKKAKLKLRKKLKEK